jgi:hypothetical protein
MRRGITGVMHNRQGTIDNCDTPHSRNSQICGLHCITGNEGAVMKGTDIQERLSDFAVRIMELCDELPGTFAGRHLGGSSSGLQQLQRPITRK